MVQLRSNILDLSSTYMKEVENYSGNLVSYGSIEVGYTRLVTRLINRFRGYFYIFLICFKYICVTLKHVIILGIFWVFWGKWGISHAIPPIFLTHIPVI